MEVKPQTASGFLLEECLFSIVGGLGKTKKQSSQPVGMYMIQGESISLSRNYRSEAEWWKDGRKGRWSSFTQWECWFIRAAGML